MSYLANVAYLNRKYLFLRQVSGRGGMSRTGGKYDEPDCSPEDSYNSTTTREEGGKNKKKPLVGWSDSYASRSREIGFPHEKMLLPSAPFVVYWCDANQPIRMAETFEQEEQCREEARSKKSFLGILNADIIGVIVGFSSSPIPAMKFNLDDTGDLIMTFVEGLRDPVDPWSLTPVPSFHHLVPTPVVDRHYEYQRSRLEMLVTEDNKQQKKKTITGDDDEGAEEDEDHLLSLKKFLLEHSAELVKWDVTPEWSRMSVEECPWKPFIGTKQGETIVEPLDDIPRLTAKKFDDDDDTMMTTSKKEVATTTGYATQLCRWNITWEESRDLPYHPTQGRLFFDQHFRVAFGSVRKQGKSDSQLEITHAKNCTITMASMGFESTFSSSTNYEYLTASKFLLCASSHSVNGSPGYPGCKNEGCRQLTYCEASCPGCPDLQKFLSFYLSEGDRAASTEKGSAYHHGKEKRLSKTGVPKPKIPMTTVQRADDDPSGRGETSSIKKVIILSPASRHYGSTSGVKQILCNKRKASSPGAKTVGGEKICSCTDPLCKTGCDILCVSCSGAALLGCRGKTAPSARSEKNAGKHCASPGCFGRMVCRSDCTDCPFLSERTSPWCRGGCECSRCKHTQKQMMCPASCTVCPHIFKPTCRCQGLHGLVKVEDRYSAAAENDKLTASRCYKKGICTEDCTLCPSSCGEVVIDDESRWNCVCNPDTSSYNTSSTSQTKTRRGGGSSTVFLSKNRITLPRKKQCTLRTDEDHPICDGGHLDSTTQQLDCGYILCKDRSKCHKNCLWCPGIRDLKCCDGQHNAVACGNSDCRGRQLCIWSCKGCPCLQVEKRRKEHRCLGQHSAKECGNKACKGLQFCPDSCRGCPDMKKVKKEKRRLQ